MGRYIYRPCSYNSGINDFGIADTIGNHLGAAALIFAILVIQHAGAFKGWIVIAVFTAGYMGYEFSQKFLPGSTFDRADIIASFIRGIASGIIV